MHTRAALRRGVLVTTLWIAAVAAAIAPASAQGAPDTALEALLTELRARGSITVAGDAILATDQLLRMYARGGNAALWTDARVAADLERQVVEAATDGLTPAHYNLGPLLALRGSADATDRAALDIARSDALLRLAHDLRHGKVRANNPTAGRDLARGLTGLDPVTDLRRMIASGNLYAELQALRPTHYIYRGLVTSLARFEAIQARGGWGAITAGPTLELGATGPRVTELRERLALTGDLPAETAAGDVFDPVLEGAVKLFQQRHALNPDGAVGPATQAELNVPLARRIEQLRVNLERARWLTPSLPDDFVAVNIAGAMAYLVRGGTTVWRSRAIVGQTSTTTPVFQDTMEMIDLNPTWTVPPGIVGEILANVRRDPEYLRRNDMQVLDRNGRPVNVSPAEIARFSAASFPYVFRQRPGPANPLGQLKLIFPNRYNVYLHDTPSRTLFQREQRTFSHGCIRLEDPIGLAELVLNDPQRWSREAIVAAIATGETRTIRLGAPLPVLILYWTAATNEAGELHLYRDVYDRDAAVLRALDTSTGRGR